MEPPAWECLLSERGWFNPLEFAYELSALAGQRARQALEVPEEPFGELDLHRASLLLVVDHQNLCPIRGTVCLNPSAVRRARVAARPTLSRLQTAASICRRLHLYVDTGICI